MDITWYNHQVHSDQGSHWEMLVDDLVMVFGGSRAGQWTGTPTTPKCWYSFSLDDLKKIPQKSVEPAEFGLQNVDFLFWSWRYFFPGECEPENWPIYLLSSVSSQFFSDTPGRSQHSLRVYHLYSENGHEFRSIRSIPNVWTLASNCELTVRCGRPTMKVDQFRNPLVFYIEVLRPYRVSTVRATVISGKLTALKWYISPTSCRTYFIPWP